jgi:pimeloyl-ACP methyl ester carboxylesterase
MTKIKSKDGTEISYWRTGSGAPLLLVHGTTADHTRWASILSAIERHFTVYAVDRRGSGESGDTSAYAIEREFEDVAAVVNSIREPVNILGHSHGAICSLETSLMTRNIAKLILYEPPLSTGNAIYPPGAAERIQALVDKDERGAAVATFFREIVRLPDHEIEMLRSLPVWKARIAAAHTIAREMRADEQYKFIPERFSRLDFSTLLLLGGDSPSFFKQAVDTVHGALKNSRIVVMPGQRHTAMDTAPDLFTGEVLKFLLE